MSTMEKKKVEWVVLEFLKKDQWANLKTVKTKQEAIWFRDDFKKKFTESRIEACKIENTNRMSIIYE